jgi:hypothetical protein
MKYLILLFLSTQIIHAEDFVIKHPTCSAKYVNNPSHNTSFQKLIVQLIKDRQYKLTVSTKRAKILEGDLYFMVDLVRSKSMLYKDCSVKVSLKSAKARHMSSRDKILASKEIKRKFPRLTRKGDERCIKALKDAFVHIPSCKTGF